MSAMVVSSCLDLLEKDLGLEHAGARSTPRREVLRILADESVAGSSTDSAAGKYSETPGLEKLWEPRWSSCILTIQHHSRLNVCNDAGTIITARLQSRHQTTSQRRTGPGVVIDLIIIAGTKMLRHFEAFGFHSVRYFQSSRSDAQVLEGRLLTYRARTRPSRSQTGQALFEDARGTAAQGAGGE